MRLDFRDPRQLALLNLASKAESGVFVGFPGGTAGKNPPARAETEETQARTLGQEDPLEEEMNTFLSVFLPGESHAQRSLGGLQPTGWQRGKHD